MEFGLVKLIVDQNISYFFMCLLCIIYNIRYLIIIYQICEDIELCGLY